MFAQDKHTRLSIINLSVAAHLGVPRVAETQICNSIFPKNKYKSFNFLLQNNGNIKATDNNTSGLLHYACLGGNLEIGVGC